jgi:hypothetical protein
MTSLLRGRQSSTQLNSDSSWILASGDSDSQRFEVTPDSVRSLAFGSAEVIENFSCKSVEIGLGSASPAGNSVHGLPLNARPSYKIERKELEIVQYGEEEPTRKQRKLGVVLLSSDVGSPDVACVL